MNSGAQFIEQLGIEFPELCEDIKEYEGLLHVQMGSFARITQAAIDAGEFETLRRQFMFADRFFRDAAPDLENAFYVSYLEHLDFRGSHGQRAQSFMSSALRKGWQDIMEYMDELSRKGQSDKRKS
ncbi:MAG: hypothetical protein PHY43_01695 [Verrucomicrobiales bacterium]|nr:hypothetical protein [Verrucomicrobiales bacterium]